MELKTGEIKTGEIKHCIMLYRNLEQNLQRS